MKTIIKEQNDNKHKVSNNIESNIFNNCVDFGNVLTWQSILLSNKTYTSKQVIKDFKYELIYTKELQQILHFFYDNINKISILTNINDLDEEYLTTNVVIHKKIISIISNKSILKRRKSSLEIIKNISNNNEFSFQDTNK